MQACNILCDPLGQLPIHSFILEIFSTGLLCVGTLLAVKGADMTLPASWNFLHSGEGRCVIRISNHRRNTNMSSQALIRLKKKKIPGTARMYRDIR